MSKCIDAWMRRSGAVVVALALALPAMAADTADTRLLSEPAVSAERIAFAYANDLWTAKPYTLRYQQLFTVPVENGFPTKCRSPTPRRPRSRPTGRRSRTCRSPRSSTR